MHHSPRGRAHRLLPDQVPAAGIHRPGRDLHQGGLPFSEAAGPPGRGLGPRIRGWSSPDRVNSAPLAAVIEDSTIVGPEGMAAGRNGPSPKPCPGWKMNTPDQFGRTFLTGTMTVDGKPCSPLRTPWTQRAERGGDADILPILSTSSGSVVWTGSEEGTSDLASHIRPGASWPGGQRRGRMGPSSPRERVVLRQEPFSGLRLSLVYPCSFQPQAPCTAPSFPGRPPWPPCWPFPHLVRLEAGNLQRYQEHHVPCRGYERQAD